REVPPDRPRLPPRAAGSPHPRRPRRRLLRPPPAHRGGAQLPPGDAAGAVVASAPPAPNQHCYDHPAAFYAGIRSVTRITATFFVSLNAASFVPILHVR